MVVLTEAEKGQGPSRNQRDNAEAQDGRPLGRKFGGRIAHVRIT